MNGYTHTHAHVEVEVYDTLEVAKIYFLLYSCTGRGANIIYMVFLYSYLYSYTYSYRLLLYFMMAVLIGAALV